MADNTIKIGGELESMATGKIVAAASAIKDKSRNKTQEVINGDVEAAIAGQSAQFEALLQETSAAVASASESARESKQYLADLQEAITELPDGQAVSAQVAVNEVDIAGLKSDVVVDLSTRYATSYANLSAALAALNNDTSTDAAAIKKGGVSVKFINSTTNKYEQWNLKASSWSTNTFDWALDADGSNIPVDKLEVEGTQSEEQAIIYETDGGVQVGKIDANGADFANLKRGGQQVARMSDLPTVPTLDTSIGSSPSDSHTPSTKAVKDYVDDNIPEVPEYPIETEAAQSEADEVIFGNDAGTQQYVKVSSDGVRAVAYKDMQGNNVIPTKDTSIGDSPSQTNVPTSKAVADYVEAHSGGIGDLPISEVIAETEDKYITIANDRDEDVIVFTDDGVKELRSKTICDNLITPTLQMSSVAARGLATMIPKGVIVDNFSFYPISNNGTDECIVWALSADNKTLTKVQQFTVTSNSSSVQHITALEKEYNADTFITFHHVSGNGAIGMVRNVISNDFALTLSNINNDTYSVSDYGMAINVDALCLKVSYKYYISPNKDLLTVGQSEWFTDITKASMAAAWDDVIHIKAGTYRCNISAWGKKIHLIGESKCNCILFDDSSDYETPPLEMNVGSIVNLTIKETHANPTVTESQTTSGGYDRYRMAYCLHAESGQNAQNDSLVIDNCDFYNKYRPCIGAGLYENAGIIVRNSTFHSGLGYVNSISGQNGRRGALYFHSNTSETPKVGQKFKAINCVFICDDIMAATINTYNNNEIDLTFINNKFRSCVNGEVDSIIVTNEEIGTHLILNDLSFANNINKLNN